MGATSFIDLLPGNNDVDAAIDVGALPLQATATAMRVTIQDNVAIYSGEEPISVAMAWRIIECRSGGNHKWWRFEAKARNDKKTAKVGDHLVVAEHPYGNGWVQHAAFKRATKAGAAEKRELLNVNQSVCDDFIKLIESSETDLWETGNYLTAGISAPQLPFSELHSIRNVQKTGFFVFGICENFVSLEKKLLTDRAIHELIKDTERGTIKFWATGAKLKSIPSLSNDVKEERWSLMLMSIRQALAGPHKDCEQWIDRPVVEKIDQIYRGHINRLNRGSADERRNQSKLADDAVSISQSQV